jgi:hypothetical protein
MKNGRRGAIAGGGEDTQRGKVRQYDIKRERKLEKAKVGDRGRNLYIKKRRGKVGRRGLTKQ